MVSALVLSFLLHVAGPRLLKPPMPLTILYEQDFSAGSSTFCSPRAGAGGTNDYYESGSNGTADAQDALYLDAAKAEAVDVTTGGGPVGQNYLDLAAGLTAGDDYSTAGVQFHVPAVVTPGSGVGAWTKRGAGVVSSSGSFTTEAWYYSTATSIAANTYAPIFELNRNISGPPSIALTASFYGGQQHLELFRAVAFGGGVFDDSYILTGYQDEWVRYQLITGVSSAPGVADGYYQVYVQIGVAGANTLVYDITGVIVEKSADVSVSVTAPATTAPDYRIATAQLGFFGLFGRAASFRIYEGTDDTIPPQVGGSMPSCCDPGNPGVGPDPVGAAPPWTRSCDNGGVVDSVADLTDGEVW